MDQVYWATKRSMNLDALFDDLLTSGVTLADPQRIRKLRVLNTVHLAFIISAPLLGLFYFYIGAVILFYVSVMVGFLMATSLVLLRKTKNVPWVGNYAISILWIFVFIISWNTGGITYEGVLISSWMLKACLILLAIFLTGYVHGTIWTVVAFLEIGLIVYLYRVRFQFPNVIPYDIAALYNLATFLVGFLLMILMAFLFESDKEEALAREQVKSLAFRESKRYIDDLLERSPVPTFVVDRNHRVVQWNSACEKLTGIPTADALGKQVWEGFSMVDGKSLADMILESPGAVQKQFHDGILSKSESGWYQMEVSLPRLNRGRQALLTAGPILGENDAIRGALQTVQVPLIPDDSMTVEGVDAPASVAEELASLVFKVNEEGKIISWNRACEERFGRASAQMLGKVALDLLSNRQRALFEETMAMAFEGTVSAPKTWRYEGGDRKPVYVIAEVYPVKNREGKVKECVVVNADVTGLVVKLRQMESDATDAKEKLKTLTEEYELLKRNIATFLRSKEE
jgi:PAS domain S-box-containing protein